MSLKPEVIRGGRAESSDSPQPVSAVRGRLLIVTAAVLWSLSGAFNNFLNHPTPLGLHEPKLDPMQVAVGRVFFAGMVLAPLVRPRDVRFRGVTIATMIAFALMNATYVPALTMGPSMVPLRTGRAWPATPRTVAPSSTVKAEASG